MRNIIILIILLILMVGICTGMEIYMNTSCKQLLNELDKVKTENDLASIEAFMKKWDKATKVWFTFVSHVDVEDISEHIYSMYKFKQEEEEAHYKLELYLVERALIETPEKIQLRWTNFF